MKYFIQDAIGYIIMAVAFWIILRADDKKQ